MLALESADYSVVSTDMLVVGEKVDATAVGWAAWMEYGKVGQRVGEKECLQAALLASRLAGKWE